ncbi:hypothetical protein KR018_009768 [Drosophila ironensis]|nr:hypothetical protein KR018_009768 [Drosophila ironensis]
MLIEDEVHGVIELPGYIQEIVENPLFQRLKKVHQLGLIPITLDPRCNHKRFDHCLGTYKSAQDHLRAIERNSRYEPKLPEWCRQAVEISALLHDVGHGPMSHVWEMLSNHEFDVSFCEQNFRVLLHICPSVIQHEQNALTCVDRIFQDARSKELVSLRDDCSGRGVQLIKALILGCSDRLPFPMMGHNYIFDIVHNRRCGLDVDKWDYLRRDNLRLKILTAEEMDFNDVFLQARISADGQRIEYRYQDYHRIYLLFAARSRLHVVAYQHPLICAADIILRGLVARCAPELLSITSDAPEWTELHDEKLLTLTRSDPMAVYLLEPQRIVEVPLIGLAGPTVLRVQRKIPGAGEVMGSDECFSLFGNKRNKRKIDRCLQPTIINKCFELI